MCRLMGLALRSVMASIWTTWWRCEWLLVTVICWAEQFDWLVRLSLLHHQILNGQHWVNGKWNVKIFGE
jgi:hypothetical protein